jgi:hypothetical protein
MRNFSEQCYIYFQVLEPNMRVQTESYYFQVMQIRFSHIYFAKMPFACKIGMIFSLLLVTLRVTDKRQVMSVVFK